MNYRIKLIQDCGAKTRTLDERAGAIHGVGNKARVGQRAGAVEGESKEKRFAVAGADGDASA